MDGCHLCDYKGCDDCMFITKAHEYFNLKPERKDTLKDKVKLLNKKLKKEIKK